MSKISDEMLQRLRGFVTKYCNNGFNFSSYHGYEEKTILHNLALAVHEFQVAERQNEQKPSDEFYNLLDIKKKNFDLLEKADGLNKMIAEATSQGLLHENKSILDLKECQESKTELENKLKSSKNLNTQLAEDKIRIENVIRKIFKEYSAIKDKYKNDLPKGFFDDDDPPESEVTRG